MYPLPFVLFVGTKNEYTGKEEYRWTILLLNEAPPRDAVFCRDENRRMRKDFLQETFRYRGPYPDENVAMRHISRFWFFRRRAYTIQIEHFPDEPFPS
jgi:hypothetical protein